MPKYINRATGEIVYPAQIHSGEVTDYMEIKEPPGGWSSLEGGEAADQSPEALLSDQTGTLPRMFREPEPPRKKFNDNPFDNWFLFSHIVSVFVVIGSAFYAHDLVGVSGDEAIFAAIMGGIIGGLAMAPFYVLIHIGSVLWQTKEQVRKLNAARK